MRFASMVAAKEKDANANKTPVIAFFGDSVTHGFYGTLFDTTAVDHRAVYHARLIDKIRMLCPAAPIEVINAGVGGMTAAGSLARLERDVLSRSPDLVVIAFGLNDVNGGEEGLPAFRAAINEIIERCHAVGAEVIYMSENMMNTYVPSEMSPSEQYYEYAHKTAEMQNTGLLAKYFTAGMESARAHGARVCDVHAKWQALATHGIDTTRLLSNGINHPTRAMHTLFADALFDCIFFDR